MAFESFLGNCLIKNDGGEIKTSELTSEKGAVVGLYFSAHWCPPCRGFTPKLCSIYKEIKSAGKDFEIVFISSDSSEQEFKSYHGEMPWLAMPYKERDIKNTCSEKFEVEGIPTLVLLDAVSGDILNTDGREVIDTYGAAGFPFTDARIEECKKELELKKATALAEMGSLSFVGPLITIGNTENHLDVESVTRSCEAVALAFMRGSNDRGSSVVIPKLLEAQETLGKSKLGVIMVPLEDTEEFSPEIKSKLEDTPMVKEGKNADEVVKRFEVISPDIQAPHVMVLTRDAYGVFKLCAEDAARDIFFTGATGFPWSSEALAALKAKENALKEEMRQKQKNLEFLSTDGQSHVVDKKGDTIPLNTLQSKDVVGLYFSAHWCGPCRGFTPRLAELYNQCKDEGKSFEVVFVSSDRDKESFEEYFAEMPWCALAFKERNLKSALSDIFDVQGIPTLVLLTGAGELITENGRKAVDYGADCFPWNEEAIKKGEEVAKEKERKANEKAKEEEQNAVEEQEKAGKIVIRRHIGTPKSIDISVEQNVEFKSYSTATAPTGLVPAGQKVLYEITFKQKTGGGAISQIGWATDGMEKSDNYETDGVGDCSDSYGFDGQRQYKWHSGSSQWGKKFDPEGGCVLGVAADLQNGKLLFGLDGDWDEPMGVAFDDIDKDAKLFPAITASSLKLSVNFGDEPFKFGPPDQSFVGLKQALEGKP